MRFVREFVTLLAILSLAVVPVIGVGCGEQPPAKPVTEPTVDLGKKGDTKPAKKKGRADESGSTTGTLGVKPPKTAPDKSTK
jgi:hypothetical protein